ncbi:MAG: RagB/SusD family nutrient uptake outer membrane protein, partial [Bacteroidales bacterium]|nr:RagB/SusD family nutrient uptake outer membrane protein [Bacteroidales bacterium]
NQAMYDLETYKSNFSDADYGRLMGECRFFRGWMYFELTKRHLQCILYDEDMTKYTRNTPLSTEEECWDFVEEDLEYAAANLPSTSSTYRVTKGAAYAMLSRSMLYAERWDVAQAAADSVIGSGLYSLMPSYKDAWSVLASEGNTESILDYEYNKEGLTHNFNDNFTPGGDTHSSINAKGTPTQEMVESYELATGGYPDWSEWHTAEGTTDTPPWDKLEPRFAATILYNGCQWKERTIEAYVGGEDGFQAWKTKPTTDGKSTTGYFLRKLLDENWDYNVYSGSLEPWIAIRYAEVLLNGAEAYCHGDDLNYEKARSYVNQVRTRVGLPGLTSTGDDLLNGIMHERKVELAYEGQLYWDMRRWKRAESEYSNYRVHGIRIDKTTAGYTYTYVEADDTDREFPEKLYQIPLPEDELESNSSVSQFTGWD